MVAKYQTIISCFGLKSFPTTTLLQNEIQTPPLALEALLGGRPCLLLWPQILPLPPPTSGGRQCAQGLEVSLFSESGW